MARLDPTDQQGFPTPLRTGIDRSLGCRTAHVERAELPRRVVALVGRVDLRAMRAMDAARRLDGDRHGTGRVGALHVLEPGEDLERFADRWLQLRGASVPLQIVDADGPVPRAVVEALLPDLQHPSSRLTVVLSRLELARPWHRWLHDRTAERIAAALAAVPRVEVRWVGVRVPA